MTLDKDRLTLYDRKTNQTYDRTYIQTNGLCQEISQDTYQWGFSFLTLFIFTLLLLLWTFGIYVVGFIGHDALRFHQGDAIGRYKAVLELADAINQNFKTICQDPGQLEEVQIERYIKMS